MSDVFGLEGKVALVVGGGLGMGEATCLTLARAGCHVALIDSVPERAERVAEAVRSCGRKALPICLNVLEEASAADAVAAVERELGRLSIMATIVGMANYQRSEEMTAEHWDQDHNRNLRYFAFYAAAAARAMMASGEGGSITAVASVSGMQSAPYHAAYGAAKAGLISYVRSLSVEWALKNIRVNSVSPGVIATPRIDSEPMREMVAQSAIPFRRLGAPQDIANAILFLASDLASFVTGQNLAVDGGFTAQYTLGPPLGYRDEAGE